MKKQEIESIKKAGQIVSTIRKELPTIIKKDMLLLELAEKIESRIIELGGKPAFPVNLSINEIAAHYTPSYNDEEKAHGLLKVDFGVHIKGFSADNSMSFDLENSDENKKLIKTAEEALENAIKIVEKKLSLGQIGKAIQEVCEKNNFSPIKNLSGHGIEEYDLHASPTIPNYDNKSNIILEDGIYAIEPFVTTGIGEVYDGKPSGIYEVKGQGAIRDKNAREVFEFIAEEYGTLPFCSRWIYKKFGARGLLSLRLIESSGALHQFSHLVEKSKAKVAQAEHTILINKGKVEVLTE